MQKKKPDNYAIFVKDVTVAYHEEPVLWDVDFYVPEGSLAGIIGPNGGGKTTLIKSMLDIVPKITGQVCILGKSYNDIKKQVAYVPQRSSIDWSFPISVFETVLMGRYAHLRWYNWPTKKDKDIALQALKQVNLIGYKDKQISELSGGQQQRVFIARALAQEADVYFMDEPFAGIDVASSETILHVLQNLKKQGKTIVVVHHDLLSVKKYFDWTLLINTKHIAIGKTQNVLTKKNIEKAFNHNPHIIEDWL